MPSLFEVITTPYTQSGALGGIVNRLMNNEYPTYRRIPSGNGGPPETADLPTGVSIATTDGEISDIYLSWDGELVITATEDLLPPERHAAIFVYHDPDLEQIYPYRDVRGTFVVTLTDDSAIPIGIECNLAPTHIEISRRLNDMFSQHNLDITFTPTMESERPAHDLGDDVVAHYYRIHLGDGIKALTFHDDDENTDRLQGIYPLGTYTREEFLDIDLYLTTSPVRLEKGIVPNNPPVDSIERVNGKLVGSRRLYNGDIGPALDARPPSLDPIELDAVIDAVGTMTVTPLHGLTAGHLNIMLQPGKVYVVYGTRTNSTFDYISRIGQPLPGGDTPFIGAAPSRNYAGTQLPAYIQDGTDILSPATVSGVFGQPAALHSGSALPTEISLLLGIDAWLRDQDMIDFIDNLTVDDLDGEGGGSPELTVLERHLVMTAAHNYFYETTSPGTGNYTYKCIVKELDFDQLFTVTDILLAPGVNPLDPTLDASIHEYPVNWNGSTNFGEVAAERIYRVTVPEGHAGVLQCTIQYGGYTWSMSIWADVYGGPLIERIDIESNFSRTPQSFGPGVYFIGIQGPAGVNRLSNVYIDLQPT